MSSYILAIDEGTTSTRAIIFDHNGQKIGEGQSEFPQYFPEPGWVEHDANEIWDAVLSTIADALIASKISPSEIAGIGITNQRETTVIWDKKTGEPIHKAIVWQSRQTSELADQLIADGYSDMFHQKTGLIIDAYFSATKVRWLLDHVPHAQERAEAGELLFGTIDTWLLWKLTNGKVHVTDYANASRTMLFNIHDLTWDKDILELLNIPKKLLPEVKSNSEIYGYAEHFIFSDHHIPISGMAGDQQAALFGQLALEEGMVKNTYGTGSFIVMNTGNQPVLSQHNLLTTIGYAINGQVTYALEGSVFVSGSALQWLRDQIKILPSAPESETAAYRSTSLNEVYVVPAFTGLGAPYWDSKARGAIFGLTRGTNSDDLIKATIQSLAYQTRDVVDTMTLDTGISIPTLRVDGGAARNNYLLQFQADILQTHIERAQNLETTALGAAFLAGLAVGFWKDTNELQTLFSHGQVFKPQISQDDSQKLYKGWIRAVKATRLFGEE
ncbi:glycerol kinase GlpK [Streptococcus hillyeri]|uniref:Glycerol kinase n=1 Tax=Streptococcus hillyeri TaxID=2282420 RepID=A0A3L9E1K2_9STRE|nr:glycerol kinase GlpK [Streptococcus hillyeri]RLY05302.1 glycerol kinase [Streptococcus hillyeri]